MSRQQNKLNANVDRVKYTNQFIGIPEMTMIKYHSYLMQCQCCHCLFTEVLSELEFAENDYPLCEDCIGGDCDCDDDDRD